MADRAKVYDLQEYREKREARGREECGCEICRIARTIERARRKLIDQGFMAGTLRERGGRLVFCRDESTWGTFPDA